MPSVDLNFDYNKIQGKLNATKTYKNAKSKYDDANKKVGESFEKSKKDVSQSLDKFKEQTKSGAIYIDPDSSLSISNAMLEIYENRDLQLELINEPIHPCQNKPPERYQSMKASQ